MWEKRNTNSEFEQVVRDLCCVGVIIIIIIIIKSN